MRAHADDGGACGTGRPVAGVASALALLALLASACAPGPAGTVAADAGAASAHAVTYALDWTRDDVATHPGEDGFTVTNDLGYAVRVTRGWITSYGVELVECPRDAAPTPLARAATRLWSALEGTAWAGHSTDTPNPAAARPMQVESLTDPGAHDVATLTLAPQTYCKLHYLLARAGAEARGLPTAPDLVGTSLHVEGTYRAPGAANDVPFTLHGASAYGALVERDADARPLRVDTGEGAARVTIRRQRARMFDGVDFARVSDRAAALQVLRAIAEHAEVRVARVADASAS